MKWMDIIEEVIKKHQGCNKTLCIGLNIRDEIFAENGQIIFLDRMKELNVKISYAQSGIFEIRIYN